MLWLLKVVQQATGRSRAKQHTREQVLLTVFGLNTAKAEGKPPHVVATDWR